jgi:hypothetical protein
MRVPRALADQYGKQPTAPLHVAAALGVQPTSGPFRTLAGAALAYGLTDGGPRAELIALTDLGRRVVAPTIDGDDQAALREAFLTPRVVGEFLNRYNGSRVPSETIGRNVLETMGVPAAATERTFSLIIDSAEALGLLTQIGDHRYVSLDAAVPPAGQPEVAAAEHIDEEGAVAYEELPEELSEEMPSAAPGNPAN